MVVTVTEQALRGVFLIEGSRYPDERGVFSEIWRTDVMAAHGLTTAVAQASLSSSARRGTLRGLHLQVAPFAQAKTIRVTRGAIFDVAVDLRPDSPTYRQWLGVELSADNGRILHLAEGFAHGFQTLTDDTEVLYFVSTEYSPAHERGYRYDDPAFGIRWPQMPPPVINARDAAFPLLRP